MKRSDKNVNKSGGWRDGGEKGGGVHMEGRVRGAEMQRSPFLVKRLPVTLPCLWKMEIGAGDYLQPVRH